MKVIFILQVLMLQAKQSAGTAKTELPYGGRKTSPRVSQNYNEICVLIDRVGGFYDTSTLVCHFVSSPREEDKRDRRDSRGDEREGQGRKRSRNESEETEEIKTFPLYPYLLQG